MLNGARLPNEKLNISKISSLLIKVISWESDLEYNKNEMKMLLCLFLPSILWKVTSSH